MVNVNNVQDIFIKYDAGRHCRVFTFDDQSNKQSVMGIFIFSISSLDLHKFFVYVFSLIKMKK